MRALALCGLLLLAACRAQTADRGEAPLTGFDVVFDPIEDGSLMVVGDQSSAYTTGRTSQCLLGQPCDAYVTVTTTSSNPAVVQVLTPSTSTFSSATWRAVGAGTAIVRVVAQQYHDSMAIQVLSARPPFDSIMVRRQPTPFDSVTSVTADANGGLQAAHLPLTGSLLLVVDPYRGGRYIGGVNDWTVQSSAPSIAYAARSCRAPSVDLTCSVVAGHGGWVTGLANGSAVITVTERNQQWSFPVAIP